MISYDESLKVLMDNYSIVDTAKNEGREEGLLEGRGEVASREKVGIAGKIINRGLPVSEIAQITGLPIEEIEKLYTLLLPGSYLN